MKDITLKITGKQIIHEHDKELHQDVMEFTTEGSLQRRGNFVKISYPESGLSGMEGCTTYITISGKKVKMKRSSPEKEDVVIMEFEKGRRFESAYYTPIGPVAMELLTNNISSFQPTAEGTEKMSIDYSIALHGLMESRNLLDIEILRESEENTDGKYRQ